jgi:hypothetical protein
MEKNLTGHSFNLVRKISIAIIILFSVSNCIAWPSAILGLLPKASKKQQVIFPPPGNSNPSPIANPESSTCDTAGFLVSPKTGILTSESGTSSSFSVKLKCAPTSDVELKISSSNTSEITTNLTSLKFTKTNWDVEQVVNLTGVDDTLLDGNKTVTIDLGSAISTDVNYSNLSAGTVEAVNADNETTGITVSALGGHIVTEAGGTSSFTVVLNSIPSGDVTIPVTSNDLTEGTVSPSSITFTNSDWNIPQTITITGVDDPNPDGNINFSVALGPSTSIDANYSNLSQPNIAVTNEDNDSAGFTIINPTMTTNESGTNGVFFVVLNSPPVANVSLPLTNNNPTEGSISTSNLTFTTSSWNIQQAVTVTGLDDFNLDGNITYLIQVGAPVSSDAAYNSISPQSVSVTNIDNDSAGFDITTISSHTSEALDTATFKVRLITAPSANVSINFSSSDPTEGTIQTGSSLTFTNANWNTYQTVTIKGVNDSLGDGDVIYSIISDPVVSGDANYNGLDPADITVINDDNDTPGVTIFAATNPLITTESAGKATFTVKLRTKPTANVTFIGILSSNTSAGTVSPANITFTATNWSVPQTITITGVNNDYLNPSGILYSITVPSPTSTDTGYNSLPTNTVNVKNNDNDTQGYTISKTKNFITADSSKSDSFTIRLNTQPVGGDVVIPVTSSNTAEVVVSPALVTFTAANWNTPQTITMTGQVDSIADGSKLITVALGTPTVASGNKDYYPNATGSDYSSVKLPDYNSALANNGMITINNCDSDAKIALCLPPISERVTSETGTSFQYYVLLNQLPTANVTFNVSVSDTNEATVSTATITKTPANWDTVQLITVTGKNDSALEAIGQQLDGTKLYNVVHSVATSTDAYYNGFDVADITNITNTDPDVPDVIMSPANSSNSRITLVNNNSVIITVRLNAQPTANTSFTLSGAGFTTTPASLTFTSADWNVNQNLTISYNGTTGGKQVVTSAFTSTDTKFNGKAVSDIFLTIVQPGFTVSSISGDTDETGTTRTFTVKLNSPPSANVSINIISTNTNEATILSGANLTFTPANWNTNQTVTVQGVDDATLDGDQTILIQLQAATSGDTSYNGLDPNDVSVINLDND